MKIFKTILVFAVAMMSLSCFAQIGTSIGKDTTKHGLLKYNLYSFIKSDNNTPVLPAFKANPQLILSENALFYDTTYFRKLITDNILHSGNKRYFVYKMNHCVDDPIAPYGSGKSVILCGTLNYLSFLFDRK